MLSKVKKKVKAKAKRILILKNPKIRKDWQAYRQQFRKKKEKPGKKEKVLTIIRLNYYHRIQRKDGYLFMKNEEKPSDKIFYYRCAKERPAVDELVKEIQPYDILSLDVFDTALYRKVDKPDFIFYALGIEMGASDFPALRKRAEAMARDKKQRKTGSRECTLEEIYQALQAYAGIESKWMQREIELEISASCVNPYIYQIYQKAIELGKTVIFVSDMYLPGETICQMLENAGYSKYQKLYLSNELAANKGNGALQRIVKTDFPNQKIIHIGDREDTDVKNSISAGLQAIYNQDARPPQRESNMDNLAGSIYQAVINNHMNNGLYKGNPIYDHGYRVGGLLALGYCQFIHRIVERDHIEKILFCARDCEIIQKIYNQFFPGVENEYLEISRYAILNVTAKRYAYDLVERNIIRYVKEYRNDKTIAEILELCGYGYLSEYLEASDISPYFFPQTIRVAKIERFILEHIDIIVQHNQTAVQAAKDYFSSLIGDAKRILVVDIGWTGSCISHFQYFVEKNLADRNIYIKGALACTNRNQTVTAAVESGAIDAYVYSPLQNLDIAYTMYPAGEKGRNRDYTDGLHLPLESLFTSTASSLLAYDQGEDGSPQFIRRHLKQPNPQEIDDLHRGMLNFAKDYTAYCEAFSTVPDISPVTSFSPYLSMLKHPQYCHAVYRNFVYDTPIAPYDQDDVIITMDSLYRGKNAKA